MAFPWQDLPGDVELDILSRLPPKSLLRSKCVCKNWLSLFSNPSFIHKHLLHRNHTSSAAVDDQETLLIHNCGARDSLGPHHSLSLLNLKNPRNPLIFNLNHPFPQGNNECDMDLVSSINGLVCLTSKADGLVSVLWNPATKHCVNIPTPNLKFLPNQGGHSSIGFCFDSLRNDYKVVRVVRFDENMEIGSHPRVELYSTVGGVVWFDVGEEVFRPRLGLGLPDRFIDCLVNFEKSVRMLGGSTFWSPQGELEGKISLLVMEDDSSSWSLKFGAGPSTSITRVGCSKKGEIVQFTEHALQLYNPETQETSNIQIDSEGSRIRFGKFKLQASNYTASLVPIRGSNQVEKEGTGGERRKIEHLVA